jgi:8-oxo-dGTP diphosphatase
VRGDGDGWVECAQGHRHWGRLGAAGLLLRTVDDAGTVRVLAQHRAEWTHDGGTWGIPGGARDSHEDAAEAALREGFEEAGVPADVVRLRGNHRVDHGGWSYTTLLADTPQPFDLVANAESAELRWAREEHLDSLPLHPGFAQAWPGLRAAPATVVVDGANVVGSRPDGWWRDRAGAAARLAAALTGLRSRLATGPGGEALVVRRTVLVLEGAARAAMDAEPDDGWLVRVAADGSGDDAVVAEAVAARAGTSDAVVVVTADRGLRARLPDRVGAAGPSWLRALLD